MTTLTVRRIGEGARVSDWIAVPVAVHRDDPHFVRQLDLKERMRIARPFNPFFRFGEAAFFVAYRDGRPVGRISAQINRLHRETHDPHSGHFGFFDCENDPEAARALFDAARGWLAARGATSIAGPFSLSINEESGLLVEGFDSPPAMLMNHAMPFTGGLVEAAGLTKETDTFAFRFRGDRPYPALDRMAAAAERSGAFTIRPIRIDRFAEEVRLVIDVFNDAWADNWGFVPYTDGEIQALIRELKPFYRSGYGRFIEHEGRPIAIILAIPDVNRVIAPFGGRLLPFNWWRLLRRLKRDEVDAARIPLMGVRRAYQGSMQAAGVLTWLVRDLIREADLHPFEWVELSWILETNRPMLSLVRQIAGEPVKRYRFYRGPIAP